MKLLSSFTFTEILALFMALSVIAIITGNVIFYFARLYWYKHKVNKAQELAGNVGEKCADFYRKIIRVNRNSDIDDILYVRTRRMQTELVHSCNMMRRHLVDGYSDRYDPRLIRFINEYNEIIDDYIEYRSGTLEVATEGKFTPSTQFYDRLIQLSEKESRWYPSIAS